MKGVEDTLGLEGLPDKRLVELLEGGVQEWRFWRENVNGEKEATILGAGVVLQVTVGEDRLLISIEEGLSHPVGFEIARTREYAESLNADYIETSIACLISKP